MVRQLASLWGGGRGRGIPIVPFFLFPLSLFAFLFRDMREGDTLLLPLLSSHFLFGWDSYSLVDFSGLPGI